MANLDGKNRRVLLVEDEKDVKILRALILAEYKLTCARNFDEALLDRGFGIGGRRRRKRLIASGLGAAYGEAVYVARNRRQAGARWAYGKGYVSRHCP